MDIQKEREVFEKWFATRYPNIQKTIDLHNNHESIVFRKNQAEAWQAAKAQAVPKGFVLVPVTPSDEFVDKLADVICDEFDTTIIGSARCATEAYKLIIEAQEPAND